MPYRRSVIHDNLIEMCVKILKLYSFFGVGIHSPSYIRLSIGFPKLLFTVAFSY
jgi:hypothetical protein